MFGLMSADSLLYSFALAIDFHSFVSFYHADRFLLNNCKN